MRMNFRMVLLLPLALLCSGCLEGKDGIPRSFFYNGKPISPVCFMQASSEVSLAACGVKTQTDDGYKIPAEASAKQDGFYGYDFECAEGCMSTPYLYYRHLGMKGDNHVVQVASSGGGTGHFTDVRVISIDSGIMTTREMLAGGDRCNGGIAKASVKDDAVSFSQYVTPFDVIQLSDGNQAGFKAYDDIQACAACCVGEADYTDGNLTALRLTRDPEEIVAEDLGPKDACFFGSYNESYNSGVTTLDHDKLLAFGRTFNGRCAQLKD